MMSDDELTRSIQLAKERQTIMKANLHEALDSIQTAEAYYAKFHTRELKAIHTRLHRAKTYLVEATEMIQKSDAV